jgi:hypothetical protein
LGFLRELWKKHKYKGFRGELMQRNKIVWDSLLLVIVISLFLGNFNHTTMAEELEESNFF